MRSSAWGASTPQALKTFAKQVRRRMRTESGGYRRDHLRAIAQRVEVDAKEVRIMGSKSALLRILVAASSAKNGGFWCAQFCTEVARPEGFEPIAGIVSPRNEFAARLL